MPRAKDKADVALPTEPPISLSTVVEISMEVASSPPRSRS